MADNHPSTDTLTEFVKVANKTINRDTITDYLYLYYKCYVIMSKIKERKEKPKTERSNDAIKQR